MMAAPKRTLPAWMLQGQPRSQAQEDGQIVFRGLIKYCPSVDQVGEACQSLICTADKSEELALGFDAEWPVNFGGQPGRIALIQVCADKNTCYLFHVSRMKYIPRIFCELINHPKVRLVGNCIKNDIRKLGRDFNIDISELIISERIVDLGSLANRVLNCSQSWSLAGLCLNLFSSSVDKSKSVRLSAWQDDLSLQQKLYAATDAFVSLLIYTALSNKTLRSESYPTNLLEKECDSELISDKLIFQGIIKYCPTVDDIGLACDHLIHVADQSEELVIGFNAKWPICLWGHPRKVTLLQVCADENTCYLFHVSVAKGLPLIFFHLLRHPKVKVVGNCIINNIQKIGSDFKKDVSQLILSDKIIDLSVFANKTLECSHSWSLTSLCLHVLARCIDETESLCISEWQEDMSPQEQVHAATEVYVSLLIHRSLKARTLVPVLQSSD